MAINRKHVSISILLLIIITSSSAVFFNAGKWLVVVEDELQPVDAIVVLMGSTGDRMLQVSELYEQGYSERVLMVNTYTPARDLLLEKGVYLKTNAEQAKEIGIDLGIPESAITIIPGKAMSTRDEAAAISEYIDAGKSPRAIMLITSSYHSRRSAAIFRRSFSRLDDPVLIITVPSEFSEFNTRKWYADRQSAKRVIMEYTRLFYFWIWERWRL